MRWLDLALACILPRHSLNRIQSGRVDEAFERARGPWVQQAKEQFSEAVRTWLAWLETEALPANQVMLAAQEAAEQAGLRVEPLHIPHLLPDAVAHRCRIGRQGLG